LVIEAGKIVERGAHDDLLARRGAYYALYMKQFRGQELLTSDGNGYGAATVTAATQ
jgi:ATP-binding cassette subfamily B protein